QERLPLVGLAGTGLLAARWRVPVAVEAGLTADRHDHRQAGVEVPLERRGVDVPAVEVVLGAQTVKQIEAWRVGTAILELDLDVMAHPRGRNHEVLDRETRTRESPCSRRASDDANQGGQHGGHHGRYREPARPGAAHLPNESHASTY